MSVTVVTRTVSGTEDGPMRSCRYSYGVWNSWHIVPHLMKPHSSCWWI